MWFFGINGRVSLVAHGVKTVKAGVMSQEPPSSIESSVDYRMAPRKLLLWCDERDWHMQMIDAGTRSSSSELLGASYMPLLD